MTLVLNNDHYGWAYEAPPVEEGATPCSLCYGRGISKLPDLTSLRPPRAMTPGQSPSLGKKPSRGRGRAKILADVVHSVQSTSNKSLSRGSSCSSLNRQQITANSTGTAGAGAGGFGNNTGFTSKNVDVKKDERNSSQSPNSRLLQEKDFADQFEDAVNDETVDKNFLVKSDEIPSNSQICDSIYSIDSTAANSMIYHAPSSDQTASADRRVVSSSAGCERGVYPKAVNGTSLYDRLCEEIKNNKTTTTKSKRESTRSENKRSVKNSDVTSLVEQLKLAAAERTEDDENDDDLDDLPKNDEKCSDSSYDRILADRKATPKWRPSKQSDEIVAMKTDEIFFGANEFANDDGFEDDLFSRSRNRNLFSNSAPIKIDCTNQFPDLGADQRQTYCEQTEPSSSSASIWTPKSVIDWNDDIDIKFVSSKKSSKKNRASDKTETTTQQQPQKQQQPQPLRKTSSIGKKKLVAMSPAKNLEKSNSSSTGQQQQQQQHPKTFAGAVKKTDNSVIVNSDNSGKSTKKSAAERNPRIRIDNLPRGCEKQTLREFLEQFGQIIDIHIEKSGKFDSAIVSLSSSEAVEWALSCLHDCDTLFPDQPLPLAVVKLTK
ncbi:uncharacterized protein LOC141909047 [Tubulanus polymorphus]|uniref:uncharacterized protein LOC141909047 n=1 Tax=Tubulanus polymorphus TaxID=672921 RepID=UPI003DA6C4CF